MITREVYSEEKPRFDQMVSHPLQSWAWGDFRQKTGHKVVRLGAFAKKKLTNAYQTTIHPLPIPKTHFKIIYFPKGPEPDQEMLFALKDLGQRKKAIFVRMEPNVSIPYQEKETKQLKALRELLAKNDCRPGRPQFTPHTFQIDLTKSEKELLSGMKEKTRYNLRLAQKHGVKVVENNSPQAFAAFQALMKETTQRQGFYAHSPDYFAKMWATLRAAKIAHLLLAQYRDLTLAVWMVFVFKKTLYYPYGASSRSHREVMPAYELMWQAMKFGQKQGCTTFDLWGSLGPNPDPEDPWFGFHRFKQGFGPQLIKFIGTYDLVVNHQLYPLVRRAEDWRWKFLRLKTKLPFLKK